MNRRRAAGQGRKRATKKRPVPKKASGQKKTAKNRPARKNGPAPSRAKSKPSRRKLFRRAAAKKKTVRAKTGSSRAQNRRRPEPKKPKPPKPRLSLRERISARRENAATWALTHGTTLRRMAQGAMALCVLAVLVWVGAKTVSYAHTAAAFAIDEIQIEGHRVLEEIDVRRAARLRIGSNIFEVSAKDARNHLLRHPWIEDATVVRKLPGRVRIEVVERNPVALVALDQLYIVSDDGIVFKRLGVDDPADLPVITGIASERFYDDLDYRTEVLLDSMALLHDYEGAGLADREPVSEIHFDGANGIELFVGNDGMNVRLGQGQHRQKLRRFRRVLERLARENTRPSYVYLDNVRSPERVTVRIP
jgi:cell division protein FtsQ